MKPRLFIGSSSESLELARAIQEHLDGDAECTVWDQGVFGLSQTVFPELLRLLAGHDCAAFVLAPEDALVIRGEKKRSTRDNVLFELGLFCGRMGDKRVFMVAPSGLRDFHLPTDLLGVTLALYNPRRSDGNFSAALGSACTKIRRALRSLVNADRKEIPPLTRYGFFSEFNDVFPSLFANAKQVTLYFIHSRRWRENQHDHIERFLKRRGTRLTALLPNLKNKLLITAIQGHFDDGPFIPNFIGEAFHSFRLLGKKFRKKVTVRKFETYPAYSFYKFDDQFVIALYPTTSQRKNVPTIQVGAQHPFGQFVLADLNCLLNKKSVLKPRLMLPGH